MARRTAGLLLFLFTLLLYGLGLVTPWLKLIYLRNNSVISIEAVHIITTRVPTLNLVFLLLLVTIVITTVAYLKNNDEYRILSVFLGFATIILFVIILFDGFAKYVIQEINRIALENGKPRAAIILDSGIYFTALAVFLNSLSLIINSYTES